jgi:hypothetical protein
MTDREQQAPAMKMLRTIAFAIGCAMGIIGAVKLGGMPAAMIFAGAATILVALLPSPITGRIE